MAAVPSYARLEDEVLQLPREDRSKLASRLLESLEDGDFEPADEDSFEPSPEWREELQRRVKEIDEGKAKMIDHTDVLSHVRARLAEVREKRQ